jgi:hypothetical protein
LIQREFIKALPPHLLVGGTAGLKIDDLSSLLQ